MNWVERLGQVSFLVWQICFPIGCLMAGRKMFHWFQLESYQFPGYFRTLRRMGGKPWIPGTILAVVAFAVFLGAWLLKAASWLLFFSGGLCSIITGWVLHRRASTQPEKKKLVFTPRVKRLYGVCLVIWILLFVLWCSLSSQVIPAGESSWEWLLICCAFGLLIPLWIALGGLIAWPIEKVISELYFRDAQRILREHPDLIRIGITGSWGKTSVKFILGTLLEEKYPTLITPASFNTPMGVTKVIRTMLEPGHRVFIAEMGARHVGDIREMCRLVHPTLGLITSVGPQHLDTFRTQERITKTKYELIEALPEDGSCFFSDDDGIVTDLWKKTAKDKTLTGMHPERDDVWAENLRVSPKGSQFTMCYGAERVECETALLGELNIRNILLCAGVCLKMGMEGKEIARGIRKLRPVEHRLELKTNAAGITVLDDAFNSNIRGAEQAFKVFKAFPGKRIVITPGMVELGSQEEEMNRTFGRLMADCCDEAILVGKKRSAAISKGMLESGFPEDLIHIAGSLDEAAEMLKNMARTGDTLLFENDLPDNYSEE